MTVINVSVVMAFNPAYYYMRGVNTWAGATSIADKLVNMRCLPVHGLALACAAVIV